MTNGDILADLLEDLRDVSAYLSDLQLAFENALISLRKLIVPDSNFDCYE